jgi:hypothetical protein
MGKCRMRGPGCKGCSRQVCKCELSDELRASKAAGQMTERFAQLAEEVARGWYSQRSASGWMYAIDEVMGLFRMRLLRDWCKADPARNVYAWLTNMVRFAGMDYSRKQRARQRLEGLEQ